MNSMIFNQVKIAAILLCLGIGGSYWAWQGLAVAARTQGRLQAEKSAKVPARVPEKNPPRNHSRLNRRSRIGSQGPCTCGHGGTGQRRQIQRSSRRFDEFARHGMRNVTSGDDGRFAVDLPRPGESMDILSSGWILGTRQRHFTGDVRPQRKTIRARSRTISSGEV